MKHIRCEKFHKNFVAGTALVALLGGTAGCSVTDPQSLTQARTLYRQTEKNPDVKANAAVALRDAQQSLGRAERAWQQNRDEGETEHLAYLAIQNVEIARVTAERNLAQKEIERLGDERQRVIIEAREREAERSRQEAQTRAQAAERAEKKAAAARLRAKKAQEEALARARETEQARKTAAQTLAEAEAARKREQEAAARSQQLQKQLAELQAKMKETDRGLVLTLGDVLFEFNKADLKAGALRNLYPLVSFLKENDSRMVTIEGHTDNVGSESYNMELSRRRAESVRRFLVENGIGENQVTARGLGEGYPVASNNTAPGRQMNRRVEVIIANQRQAQQTAR